MKNIKAEVIGYIQVGFMGRKFDCLDFDPISKKQMALDSELHFRLFNIKSKFRPVYKRNEK